MRALLALVLFCLASMVGAQTIPTCTTGMAPYRVEYGTGYTGLTPAEACTAAGLGFGSSTGSGENYGMVLPSGKCQLYYETAGPSWQFTVTHACEPATATPPESGASDAAASSAQYSGLMGVLVAAFAVICFGLGFNSGWTR